MKEINTAELKQIQLDILSSLDKFCTENNIKYSMAGGTLIGAVRHKGYIPWDDDIDVFMLREEYDKLISAFPEVYEGQYFLRCLECDPNYNFAYGNLCDNRTTLIEDANTGETNVNIDIFPIDDVPGIDEGWKKYLAKLTWIDYLKNTKVIRFSSDRSILKNIFLFFCKALLLPFTLNYFVRKCNAYAKRFNGRGLKWVYFSCFGPYGRRLPHLKSDYDDYVDLQFEGRTFKAMRGYDEYLTSVFGDYMQLPPVEKRVTHHDFKAYWKD